MKTSKISTDDIIYFLACCLCTIPILISIYPPMVDTPAHAAQIFALKSKILNTHWDYSNLFSINIFTPYLLGYSIIAALSIPIGIVASIKLVVAISLIFFLWFSGSFCKKFHIPNTLKLSLLIIPYGFAYQWGFLNFLIAAPLGFLFLQKTIDWNFGETIGEKIKISTFLHILFFSHLLITAFFTAVALIIMLHRENSVKAYIKKTLPFLSIAPLVIAWAIIGINNHESANEPIIWLVDKDRLISFLPLLTGIPNLIIGNCVGIILLLLPFHLGGKIKKIILIGPFLFYLLVMFLVPHGIGGNAFTYQRFGIFGLPLYFIAFSYDNTPKNSKLFSLAISSMIIIATGFQIHSSIEFNKNSRNYRDVIQYASPGKRMLLMSFDKLSKANKYAPLMLHFGSWYQAEQGGMTEFNFSRFWGMPLLFKDNKSPGIYPGFEWSPEQFNWQLNNGADFDYFLVRIPEDASLWINEKTQGRMKPVIRNEEWQLYKANRN